MFRIHFRRRILLAFSIPYLNGVGTLRQKNSLDHPHLVFFLLWTKKKCLMSHADALAQRNSSLYLKYLTTVEWVFGAKVKFNKQINKILKVTCLSKTIFKIFFASFWVSDWLPATELHTTLSRLSAKNP